MRTLERFPDLFKKSTANGKVTIWKIWTEGSVIHTETGYVGQKMRRSKDIIKKGKNIGRSNETTAEEQAYSEAQSKFNKYKDKGYTPRSSGVPGKSFKTILPMRAHEHQKYGHKLTFPFYAQPKLDGLKALVVSKALMSRNGKKLAQLKHILEEVEQIFKGLHIPDGEIYTHRHKENFEGISSGARKVKGKSDRALEMEYHVYDLVKPDLTYTERLGLLKKLFAANGGGSVKRVKTYLVKNQQELDALHERFLEEGYEGTMVRQPSGKYEIGKRSYLMQKIKTLNDSEFRIVGMEEGRGQLMGHVGKFICEIQDERGKRTFKAKLGGKNITPFLKKCFKNPKLWKGKWMQVHYMGISNKNFLPRHPRGIKFREIE